MTAAPAKYWNATIVFICSSHGMPKKAFISSLKFPLSSSVWNGSPLKSRRNSYYAVLNKHLYLLILLIVLATLARPRKNPGLDNTPGRTLLNQSLACMGDDGKIAGKKCSF